MKMKRETAPIRLVSSFDNWSEPLKLDTSG
jgi:hypothetical protein